MRTVNATPLPPGVRRRKQLRQEKRADRLRHLWRTTVFLALAAGLGYALLREGWTLRDPAQVEVRGSTKLGSEQVIQAGGIEFPQPLLQVSPTDLGRKLSTTLPVNEVRVRRLMLPPRLQVEMVDRKAVARAQRRTAAGIEKGYVDSLGQWIGIPSGYEITLAEDSADLLVVGWQPRHEATLATVLSHRERIGPELEQVRFEPDGSLWLRMKGMGPIRLGPIDGRLDRRLQVVAHLRETLPATVRGRRPQLIDLTDPEQPELSLPGAPKQPPASAPAPD